LRNWSGALRWRLEVGEPRLAFRVEHRDLRLLAMFRFRCDESLPATSNFASSVLLSRLKSSPFNTLRPSANAFRASRRRSASVKRMQHVKRLKQ
jgi:hypothetical protein